MENTASTGSSATGRIAEVEQRGIDPNRPYPPDPYSVLPEVPAFSLVSTDFSEGDVLPGAVIAVGGNRSPQLSWSGFPASAKSFAFTCFDPDAPRPGGFWHWLVVDLPPEVNSLPAGAGAPNAGELPSPAVQLRNDAGIAGYFGARPPSGDHPHRYIFAVHALDVPHLDLDQDARGHALMAALVPHTVARATLTGTFAASPTTAHATLSRLG